MAEKKLYLALGDSLTVGYGTEPEQSFVQRYYRFIKERCGEDSYELVNAGVNGATARDMSRMIEDSEPLQSYIRRADLITLTAGGNDLLQAAKAYLFDGSPVFLKNALKQFQNDYAQLVGLVRGLNGESGKRGSRSGKTGSMLLIGLYNPIPGEEEATFWVQAFNRQMAKLAGGSVHYIDVFEAFSGREERYLSEDHIHPNGEGYRVIAEQAKAAKLF